MIKLDIFSDPICPWCYIGHSHLSKAAAMLPEAGIRYRHLPFFLNPRDAETGHVAVGLFEHEIRKRFAQDSVGYRDCCRNWPASK